MILVSWVPVVLARLSGKSFVDVGQMYCPPGQTWEAHDDIDSGQGSCVASTEHDWDSMFAKAANFGEIDRKQLDEAEKAVTTTAPTSAETEIDRATWFQLHNVRVRSPKLTMSPHFLTTSAPTLAHCEVSEWGKWAFCNATCGTGAKRRYRYVTKEPRSKTDTCPTLLDEALCNTKPCPTPVPTPWVAPTPKPPPTPQSTALVDCEVSPWSPWSNCSSACGGGKRARARKVLVAKQGGGSPCPAVTAAQDCGAGKCPVAVGQVPTPICGGVTPDGPTPWRLFGHSGLYVDVDTSACAFKMEPQYVMDVIGSEGHWQLAGTESVSEPGRSSFRVIVLHPSLKGLELLLAAQYYHWQVSWVGSTSFHSGQTKAGLSGWRETFHPKSHRPSSLYVDVDTSALKLKMTPSAPGPPVADGSMKLTRPSPPLYFVALRGKAEHYRASGSHVVYFATEKGFRAYVVWRGGHCTPAQAEGFEWRISFIALDLSDAEFKTAGQSGLDWQTATSKTVSAR